MRMPCRVTDDPSYDPDYRAAPQCEAWWWVEVLMKDGEEVGFAVRAKTDDEAVIDALNDASCWGYKPDKVLEVTQQ